MHGNEQVGAEAYGGLFFDLCVEEVRDAGFRVQAIIWGDEGDSLVLLEVVGGMNVILETQEIAEIVARNLAKKWIDENWQKVRSSQQPTDGDGRA